MNTARSILSFVLLFGFGTVAGSSFTRSSVERQTRTTPRTAPEVVDAFLARKQADLTSALGLSASQLDASTPALEAARAKLIAQQTRARSEVFHIMEEYRAELAKTLTPEQRAALDQAMEKYRKQYATPAK
jgi:Spy/CpxP family protein refolding chaperone